MCIANYLVPSTRYGSILIRDCLPYPHAPFRMVAATRHCCNLIGTRLRCTHIFPRLETRLG